MKLHTMEPHSPYENAWECTKQETYGLFLYKLGSDWAFNMYKHGKLDELLTCGTEKALDYWYHKLSKEYPNYNSEMFCTISTKPIEGATCILELQVEHPDKDNSHNYSAPISGVAWWVCEY